MSKYRFALIVWLAFWAGMSTHKHVVAGEGLEWANLLPSFSEAKARREGRDLEFLWVNKDPDVLAAWRWVRPPPPRYDFEPRPSPEIVTVNESRMAKVCLPNSFACTLSTYVGAPCTIYVLDELPSVVDRGNVLRHEKAHCNGWRHPGDGGNDGSPDAFNGYFDGY